MYCYVIRIFCKVYNRLANSRLPMKYYHSSFLIRFIIKELSNIFLIFIICLQIHTAKGLVKKIPTLTPLFILVTSTSKRYLFKFFFHIVQLRDLSTCLYSKYSNISAIYVKLLLFLASNILIYNYLFIQSTYKHYYNEYYENRQQDFDRNFYEKNLKVDILSETNVSSPKWT